ncbi:MAG: DUF5916 domain-containing protein [Bacteroidota bacterium]
MKNLLCLTIFCLVTRLSAQHYDHDYSLRVGSVDKAPLIDGRLDEADWQKQVAAQDFMQYFPTDTLLAEAKTEIYMMADDATLYVGIRCYSSGNDWIVTSLRRDFRAGGNDNITLVFDSFDDQTNAIFFGINPEGVIREGLISGGGNQRQDFSESWDNKWVGEASKFDGGYTAELAIPFSTLRYKAGNNRWGFLSYRFDTQTNERSTWPPIPQNQILFNLAHTGPMVWDDAPPESNSNISLIPFVSAGTAKDFEEGEPSTQSFDFGGDAKIALTSGLNLDVTVNPDFSQVEVDRQITNLDRFEIFFPERRQFFLENADLFGQFGFGAINPFFSRRIGVGVDTSTDVTIQNRILGGARLSGKVDQNTRIGLLNMHTASNQAQGLPATNYSVLALQRNVLDRSNIGLIAVNKQSFGEDVEGLGLNKFNRVVGVDFNYASADNSWTGKTFTHASFTSDGTSALAHGTRIERNTRPFGSEFVFSYVGDDYNAETGFIRRTNFLRASGFAESRLYPSRGSANRINLGAGYEFLWRPDFGLSDRSVALFAEFRMNSTANFEFGVEHSFVHLFDEFDPTGTDSQPLAADQDFEWFNAFASFGTNSQVPLFHRFGLFVGEYFNGSRYGIRGTTTYVYKPKGSVQLDYAVNFFDMPHLDEIKSTVLIGPRIDYTFSRSLFTTVFVQYNSQSQNTNINARLQWRFAPVSDFFLVFTDNYFTGNSFEPSDRFVMNIRNRSIVAKLTYWLNV